ncbi:hypothetical protein [Streptomyces sp. NPDC056010]|uniref:hypothetical protein n=1 Tax=Streptomyces sp. NPDC056010 TaxID=3345679 RepID=UPI0035E284B0
MASRAAARAASAAVYGSVLAVQSLFAPLSAALLATTAVTSCTAETTKPGDLKPVTAPSGGTSTNPSGAELRSPSPRLGLVPPFGTGPSQ